MRHSVAIVAGLVAACGRLDFGARGRHDGSVPAGDGADDGADALGDAAGACLPGYLLCDGFEKASLAPWWTSSGSGVALDATVAHRGTQSLHVHVDDVPANEGASAIVTETTTFVASSSTTFYVRAFARMSAIPDDNLGLIETDQTSGMPDGDGVFATSSGLTVFSQFSEKSRDAGFTPMDGAWTCLVWTVVRATDATGSLVLDGDATASLTNVQTDGNPPIDEMDVGIELAGPTDTVLQPAIDVWIDDVIVAASPLTCAD
ncbi:MAG TPA: hypothetical protein VGL61_31710 [Kofleriaceae bacterium]